MKKIIILAVVMIVISFSAIGQTITQSTAHKDFYYLPQHFSNCGITVDNLMNLPHDNSSLIQLTSHHKLICLSNSAGINYCLSGGYYDSDTSGIILHFTTDSTLRIAGIATFIFYKSTDYTRTDTVLDSLTSFQLRDSTFNNVLFSVSYDSVPNTNPSDLISKWYEFMFDTVITISSHDFGIAMVGNFAGSMFIWGYDSSTCVSTYPLYSIYADTVTSMGMGNDMEYGCYPFVFGLDYGTPFIMPILADDRQDTTGGNTASLHSNPMVEKFSYLYPNPTQKEVTVACSFDMRSVELYNTAGQKVFAKELTGKTHTLTIDVSTLAKGTYLCKILTPQGWTNKKVVVN